MNNARLNLDKMSTKFGFGTPRLALLLFVIVDGLIFLYFPNKLLHSYRFNYHTTYRTSLLSSKIFWISFHWMRMPMHFCPDRIGVDRFGHIFIQLCIIQYTKWSVFALSLSFSLSLSPFLTLLRLFAPLSFHCLSVCDCRSQRLLFFFKQNVLY